MIGRHTDGSATASAIGRCRGPLPICSVTHFLKTSTSATFMPTTSYPEIQTGWRVLLLRNEPSKHDTLVRELGDKVGHTGAVLTPGDVTASLPYEKSTADAVFSIAPGGAHTADFLARIIRMMRPGAFLVLLEPAENRTFDISNQLGEDLTLNGFVSTRIGMTELESIPHVEIVAFKPDYEIGVSEALPLRKRVKKQSESEKKKKSEASAASVWGELATDDTSAAALIDEEQLLDEADRDFKPDVRAEGCEPRANKKACKNCTCGLAEEEAAGKQSKKTRLTLEMLENPGIDSSCGSAFKPGEKIELPDDFLAPDF